MSLEAALAMRVALALTLQKLGVVHVMIARLASLWELLVLLSALSAPLVS
jgi:hypothetical protein